MASTFRGLLGEKLGMTQVFDENNRLVPVTVVKAGPCVVTQVRTPEVDGYSAVQLGFGEIDPRKVNKPEGGHFTKAGVTPRRHLVELRTEDAGNYTVGQELTAEVFDGVAKVDVIGTSKGKGTAGVMKRHGFKGLGAAHGTQRKHRSPGSIGACATPSRVFKGVRMAGRMGAVRQTTQNLTVHAVDAERGLLLIKGAVPGPRGSVVLVKTAAKGAWRHGQRDDRRRRRRGQRRRYGAAARGAVRRPDQRAAHPPGRRRPAGRGPPGHARHEAPWRDQRRRQEALQAEGPRPRPAGLDPCAAVHRRRYRPRPDPPRLRA